MKENETNASALSELPGELLPALVEFRAQHGAKWKKTLLEGWVRAAYPGALQQIRNNFGPSWLGRVKDAEFEALAPSPKVDVTDSAPRVSRMRM